MLNKYVITCRDDEPHEKVTDFDHLLEWYNKRGVTRSEREKLEMVLGFIKRANVQELSPDEEREIVIWVTNPRAKLTHLFKTATQVMGDKIVTCIVITTTFMIVAIMVLSLLLWMRPIILPC